MHYEKKLIEGNFPCQEVGAETRRERDTGMAPPTHRLHVWWARRPLTPSRAAILGSILSADTDPNVFLKDLGIVKKQAIIGDNRWTLVGKNIEFIEKDGEKEYIPFNEKTRKALDKENIRREKIMNKLTALSNADSTLNDNQVFTDWKKSNTPLIYDLLHQEYPVEIIPANPSEINQRIDLASSDTTKLILGDKIKIDPEDLYAYSRAYSNPIQDSFEDVTVLDPTSGGGSIPFEAIRLGCNVIANDLNPVATGIEMATLSYPVTFGIDLYTDLEKYGDGLVKSVADKMSEFYHFSMPNKAEKQEILSQCNYDEELFRQFNVPEYDHQGYLYYREVTCPHCGEKAPLLNAFALAKKKDGWMVIPQIDTVGNHKKV